MKKLLIAGLCSLVLTVIAGKLIIPLLKKIKAGQTVLEYVETHKDKNGTPTMGGLFFISIAVISFFIFGGIKYRFATVSVTIGLAFMIVGFLDDFIKIKLKHNQGLKAYQKIIFQILIAVIVAVFVFNNKMLTNSIYLPFSVNKLNLGAFIIPFIVLVFLATTNSVNLTDGLDGLAGGVSLIFFFAIAVIGNFYMSFDINSLQPEYVLQMQNLNTICWCVCGGLLAFLVFNFYPAKIFMGDTGSLSLGGLMAVICSFNGTSLYIPIIGLMFVVSAVSVILQVLYFKRTKKRIFLMAPFHHHLQHKGMYETKIVFIYIVITLILALASFWLLGLV